MPSRVELGESTQLETFRTDFKLRFEAVLAENAAWHPFAGSELHGRPA